MNKIVIEPTTKRERLAYTAQEAAQMLGVSHKTIFRLCQRGLLKRSPALRTLLIPADSIRKFLALTD